MRIEISDETVRLVKKAVAIIEEVAWDRRNYDPATTALICISNAIDRESGTPVAGNSEAPSEIGGADLYGPMHSAFAPDDPEDVESAPPLLIVDEDGNPLHNGGGS